MLQIDTVIYDDNADRNSEPLFVSATRPLLLDASDLCCSD